MSNEFVPRIGAQTNFFSCDDPCFCPPSLVTWFTPRCPGTIAGRVTDGRTGDGLQDINIWVESSTTRVLGEASTNGLGLYQIENLEPADDYCLFASGPGYSYRALINGYMPDEGLIQNVQMVKTGAVSGKISDSDGVPISSAVLYFTQRDEPAWSEVQVETDEEGKFCYCDFDASSVFNLNGSTFDVTAVHPDYSSIRTTISVQPHYSEYDATILPGTMVPKATITGHVSMGGSPVQGATIIFSNSDSGLLLTGSEQYFSNGNGNFSIEVDAPCTYVLLIQGMETTLARESVSVEPGETEHISMSLQGPGSLTGTITDLSGQPVPNASIEVLTFTGKGPVQNVNVFTNASGVYAVPYLQPSDGYMIDAVTTENEMYTRFHAKEAVIITSGQTTICDIQIDTIAPTCEITSIPAGASVSGIATVSVNVSDNQGVLFVDLIVNDAFIERIQVSNPIDEITINQQQVSFTWNTKSMTDGTYIMTAKVYDLAGNSSEHNILVSVQN
jgi:hypothetical protein